MLGLMLGALGIIVGRKTILRKPRNYKNQFFNPDELRKGIEVEQEHTKSVRIAKLIAKDHLMEDPFYYTKLLEWERS